MSKKWLSAEEVKTLRKSIKEHEDLNRLYGRFLGIRDRCLIECFLATGIRASELRAIRISDLSLDGKSEPFIKINSLKRRKKTVDQVVISKEMAQHLKQFLKDKELYGQPVDKDVYLFPGRYGGQLSLIGLEQAVKAIFKRAGLPQHFGCHSLRHTHASFLYWQSKDIRLVMHRLRHSSLSASTIYTAVNEIQEKQVINSLYA